MSPVLLRPIREQFQHNRVIRLLQGRYRRRYSVATNVGDEPEATAVKFRGGAVYPDLVLTVTQGPRRRHGVVEVETAESVNRLEAMAEWVLFAKLRGAFYLYVPSGTADIARRLCEQQRVAVSELWSYHPVGEQIRFTLYYRSSRLSSARRIKAKGGAESKAAGSARRAGQAAGMKTRAAATKDDSPGKAKEAPSSRKAKTQKTSSRKAKTQKTPARKAKAQKTPARKAKTQKTPARKVVVRKSSSVSTPASSRGRRTQKPVPAAGGKVTSFVEKVRTLVKKAAPGRSGK